MIIPKIIEPVLDTENHNNFVGFRCHYRFIGKLKRFLGTLLKSRSGWMSKLIIIKGKTSKFAFSKGFLPLTGGRTSWKPKHI